MKGYSKTSTFRPGDLGRYARHQDFSMTVPHEPGGAAVKDRLFIQSEDESIVFEIQAIDGELHISRFDKVPSLIQQQSAYYVTAIQQARQG